MRVAKSDGDLTVSHSLHFVNPTMPALLEVSDANMTSNLHSLGVTMIIQLHHKYDTKDARKTYKLIKVLSMK